MVSSQANPVRRHSLNIFSNAEHKRIINVTHMIPYEPVLQTNGFEDGHKGLWKMKQRDGHSALYSGIDSLSADWNNLIIGFVGELYEQEENGKLLEYPQLSSKDKESLVNSLAKENVVPVFLDKVEHHGHYEGYCKSVLWPLFHYMLWDQVTDGREERRNWDEYVKVNQRFADKIVEVYQLGDIVWIHDYHLLLVPDMLRERLPEAPIGLFIHAPFPSSEVFRCLPRRKEILNGMLGANQVGFQTYSYARHFISNCIRILGYESTPKGIDTKGVVVAVGTFPIGIDTKKVEASRKNPGVAPKMAALREMYADKKIIVGRDKLDLVKGVKQKLKAFEKFLNDYPQWRNKVVLIQVTSPALNDSPKLERKISELISHINGIHGSLEFTPIHHYHNHIDQDEYYALLSVADIGLITSVRDGMNTTSLEYIMCQQENHGPLILSEFTGMAGSLSAAIMVNPWDYNDVAQAIHEALEMPKEEKQMKHKQLYQHVTCHTAQFWARSFIKELRENLLTQEQSNTTPYLKTELLLNQYAKAKERLFLLDYDGTLTPIVKTPSAAVPSQNMLEALRVLSSNPQNHVWVVSGRDQEALDGWLGSVLPKIGLSAEHGSFIKYPETGKWINLTDDLDMSWKNDVEEIFTYYTERTQGSLIEQKRCSLTWHYRQADPVYGAFQAKEMQNHLENAILPKLPVEILLGKKNLEVRPTLISKGEIVKRLLGNLPQVDFVFCAGDDKTDEDMFRAVRKSDLEEEFYFCTTIGPATKKTLAQWHVRSPEEVINALEKMKEMEAN